MTVTTAAPKDTAAIVTLLEEMDQHYGATDLEPIETRARQVEQALFGDVPAAYALLAWDGSDLVGIASYSFLWPAAGLTRSLYLKELYVTEARRRSGVGKALMRELLDIAVKHECSRVEWTTDDDNHDAQRFYERLGLALQPSKLFYRADGATLQAELP